MTLAITQELKDIRKEADTLGISYHHRAGPAKIQAAITSFHAANVPPVEDSKALNEEAYKELPPEIDFMTEAQFNARNPTDPRQEANRLVRIRVTCMNPVKKEWPGELLSVGSAFLGTFKKFVPFDNTPYHVPQIILDFMLERKCSSFYTETDSKGNKTRKSKLVDEFNIDLMTPLTFQEMKDLAQQQAMREGQQVA